METTCQHCQHSFIITEADQAYYKRLGVPKPVRCPACRFQLRLTNRNEHTLYQRQCAVCGNNTLSVYSPDKKYTVYCRTCWWSDTWNPLDYGQDIDFTRPLFDQLLELKQRVPRIALMNDATGENSDYCNHVYRLKNCYMVYDATDCENSLYSLGIYYVKDSIDCSYNHKCELCYETTHSEDCYNVNYSWHVNNCRDSYFLTDCNGCSNCFMSVGLRNKSYCIFNQQYNPEDYAKKLASYQLDTRAGINRARDEFNEFTLTVPYKYYRGLRNEMSSGDYLVGNLATTFSFQTKTSEHCAYCFGIFQSKDCYDFTVYGEEAELLYEAHACGGQAYGNWFCNIVWHGQNNLYCDQCLNGPENCFGCIGLKNEKYCILNKQYSETDYNTLKDKLIEHMKQTGEWGQFFSPALSTYAYNETMAQEMFPLTKAQARASGWMWQDQLPGTYGKADATKQIYDCTHCHKSFKLIPQELKFYATQNIPWPEICPDCRHIERMKHRVPYQLWHKQCMNTGCKTEFETTYSPDRKELVYCEDCYTKTVV